MVNIRTMLPTDRTAVAELIFESTNRWYQRHFGTLPFASSKDTSVFFDLYQTLDPDCGIVAEVDGVIAGSCFFHPRETHMSLGIMNAHPEYFGQGIATKMLAYIMNEADRRQQPLRLVSSAMNLDSFSLYNRAGFVPRLIFNDLMFNVPENGLNILTPNTIKIRSGRPADAKAMVECEFKLVGVRRSKDIAHFLENRDGYWHVSIAEQANRMTGWLVSCGHVANRMLGPGCMSDDVSGLALISQELNLFRGRSVMVMVPANHNNLVRQLYAYGARNSELHFAQCRGQWVAPVGLMIPTFLPETA